MRMIQLFKPRKYLNSYCGVPFLLFNCNPVISYSARSVMRCIVPEKSANRHHDLQSHDVLDKSCCDINNLLVRQRGHRRIGTAERKG
jgi:hypothetical protein